MGNCQAIDAAALVIQHPGGKLERFYCSLTATEVMKLNPGHYVSLIIPLPLSEQEQEQEQDQKKTVRFTRVKLLRPTDTLALGHAYRLITSQEVHKFLRAKKYAKMNRHQPKTGSVVKTERETPRQTNGEETNTNQGAKLERDHPRTGAISSSMRAKSWRPSLQSIHEATT